MDGIVGKFPLKKRGLQEILKTLIAFKGKEPVYAGHSQRDKEGNPFCSGEHGVNGFTG
jgi:hypothetical protein